MTSLSIIQKRIATLEQAAADAVDPEIMASKMSSTSKRVHKQCNFCLGLQHDVERTRTALLACCCRCEDGGSGGKSTADASSRRSTTFGALFDHTGGEIANLNRALQNLKHAQEISFRPECFFVGPHDHEIIVLQDAFFWKNNNYAVDDSNAFRRHDDNASPEHQRQGRSHVQENLATLHVATCWSCQKSALNEQDRWTIRGHVFHRACLTCVVCGSHPRSKSDFVTFDGHICCSADCIRKHDGAHIQQERK